MNQFRPGRYVILSPRYPCVSGIPVLPSPTGSRLGRSISECIFILCAAVAVAGIGLALFEWIAL